MRASGAQRVSSARALRARRPTDAVEPVADLRVVAVLVVMADARDAGAVGVALGAGGTATGRGVRDRLAGRSASAGIAECARIDAVVVYATSIEGTVVVRFAFGCKDIETILGLVF